MFGGAGVADGATGGAGGVGGVLGDVGVVGGEIGEVGVVKVWMTVQVISNHLDSFPSRNAILVLALGSGADEVWMGGQDDQVPVQDAPGAAGVVCRAPRGL